jgi:preprotein translocase subunit Sss1
MTAIGATTFAVLAWGAVLLVLGGFGYVVYALADAWRDERR